MYDNLDMQSSVATYFRQRVESSRPNSLARPTLDFDITEFLFVFLFVGSIFPLARSVGARVFGLRGIFGGAGMKFLKTSRHKIWIWMFFYP